jgi:hypothetical protein
MSVLFDCDLADTADVNSSAPIKILVIPLVEDVKVAGSNGWRHWRKGQ